MTTYSDYFEIRQGYYSVVSAETIKEGKDRWQDTYPHKTFIEMLRKTERILARNTSNDKKPLWIHGAYGTGKSRVAWTLGQLLTCSPQELIDYFAKYKDLRELQDLRARLLGHKAGNQIVVATRFGSGDVTSVQRLVSDVYESVSDALRKRKLNIGTTSLVDAMITWLQAEENRAFLTAKLNKEEVRGKGGYGGLSGEEVLVKLKEMKAGEEHPDFLNGLLEVCDNEGVRGLSFDVPKLKAWLQEVIEINHLKALFLFWDEFSDFFRQGVGFFGSFQQLAELATTVPFELCIVTHFAESILPEKEQSSKVVRDRFTLQPIELPDYTAFKLLGDAFHAKPEHKEEWSEYQRDLNKQLEEARNAVNGIVPGLQTEDFMDILPFHPYAALILKNIATLFDSNQRSMFEFISNQDENLHAFQWFIRKYGPDEKQFLTIDMLWDYFYQADQGGLGQGRNNLDQRVREIMDSYPPLENKQELNTTNDQWNTQVRKALKTVIILQALAQKMPRAKEFQTTEKNLTAAFNGQAELENGQGMTAIEEMVKSRILAKSKISDGITIYQLPIGIVTDPRIQERAAELIKQLKLKNSDLIKGFNVEELLNIPVSMKGRFSIKLAAKDTCKKLLNQLGEEKLKGYKMRLMLACVHDESGRRLIVDRIKESLQEKNGIIYVLADTLLDEDSVDEWAMSTATAEFWLNKDKKQSDYAAEAAENILKTWASNIHKGKFRLWSANHLEGIVCDNGSAVIQELQTEIENHFDFCFDFLKGLSEALFKNPTAKTFESGLAEIEASPLSRQHVEILLRGVKGVQEYWNLRKDLPLSKLKKKVDAKITTAFTSSKEGRISIREIVDFLLEKGFMPTMHCAYLTAFLLKEYAKTPYRYSDGQVGGPLDLHKMAGMLNGYFTYLRGIDRSYRDQYIEVLTPELLAFLELAKSLFQLNENRSIELTAIQIAEKIKAFGYPLWSLESLPESAGLEEFLEKFALLLNPKNGSGSTNSLGTDIGSLILAQPKAKESLQQILSKENAEKGMKVWLDHFEDGAFRRIIEDLQVQDPLKDIRRAFGSEGVWLWDKETGVQQIRSLLKQYQFVADSVRCGFISKVSSLQACYAAWQEKIRQIRIPCAVLREVNKEVRPLLALLLEIAKRDTLAPESKQDEFDEWIKKRTDAVHDFFANCRYLFRSLYQKRLEGLSEEDKERLYVGMDMSSFQQEREKYERLLDEKIKDIRSRTLRRDLCEIWEQKTGTKSPADWSQQHRTPLPALIPQKVFKEMKPACDAVNNPNTPNDTVERSLAFFQKNPEVFDQLSQADVDEAFQNEILQNYAVVLKDLNQVRSRLVKELGDDAYSWLENPATQRIVKALAKTEYEAHGRELVNRKIDAMTPDEAKTYLKQLVFNEFEVGIKILSE